MKQLVSQWAEVDALPVLVMRSLHYLLFLALLYL